MVRGAIARRRFELLRERHRAAVTIQKYARRQVACRRYRSVKENIVILQSGANSFRDINLGPDLNSSKQFLLLLIFKFLCYVS